MFFFSGELFHRFVLLAILLCGLCLIFALYILTYTHLTVIWPSILDLDE